MDFSREHMHDFMDKAISFVLSRKKQFFMGVAVAAGLVCFSVGYYYYNHWVQVSAHRDLIAAMRYYDAPVGKGKTVISPEIIEFASSEEKWKKVEETYKENLRKHRGAGIAPIFQSYVVESLIRQGKTDDARQELAEAMRKISSVQVRDFFEVKLALLKIDSGKADLVQEGVADLKRIADSGKHAANELGLYYLGYFYWTRKDFVQVKNYWQQYMVKYGYLDAKLQSGLVEVVKEKLSLISAEW